jgi:hypothetical protein
MRAGQPLSHPISFASGLPEANVSWEVFTTAGDSVAGGEFEPAAGAVSGVINIPGIYNELGEDERYAVRDLVWSYTVDGLSQYGEHRFTLEGPLPFGVRREGVRSKLGVAAADVPDEDINLIRAYLQFQTQVTSDLLLPFTTGASYYQLIIADAIEALAALALIPTMAVRIAKSESSGTNQFARDKVDWAAIGAYLEGLVSTGQIAVNPTLDPSVSGGAIFLLTAPGDPFTGS